jgi:hypothetical protein
MVFAFKALIVSKAINFIQKKMKLRYMHSRTMLLAAIFLTAICFTANAQRGRPLPPWVHEYPGRPVIVRQPQRESRQVRQDDNYNYDNQPYIQFGIHFDPLVSWFSTDSYDTRSDGAVAGFIFGLSYNKYFGRNYSFSSGVNIIRAGGRLINREETNFEMKSYYNTVFTVDPGEVIVYKTVYLSVPLGLKLQTSDFGYGRFFTDVGFDPMILLGGRADIPSLNIKGGNANPELNLFNLAFHVNTGLEYPLSGENYFTFGLGFETNLFNATKDNVDPFSNIISQKILSLRLGLAF